MDAKSLNETLSESISFAVAVQDKISGTSDNAFQVINLMLF